MPFRTALSGLNAASAELRVIGHNIANSATTGFKKSRTEFADIFATSSLGVSSNAIGSGVRVSSVSQQFSQGNIGFTDNNLDLAISGQGFFIVNDGGISSYSRSGQFGVDRSGYVVNNTGSRLQVFQADNAGNITGARGDLQLDTSDIAPQATSLVDFGLNLDASALVPVTAAATTQVDLSGSLDSDDASASVYTMPPFTIYDSYGGAHTATISYTQNTVDSEWVMSTDIDGTALPPNTVTFNSEGALTSINGAAPNASSTVSLGSYDPGTGADLVQITASLAGLSAISNGVTGTGNNVTSVVTNTDQVYNAVFAAGAVLDGDHAINDTVSSAAQSYTDSQGVNHPVIYRFDKTSANAWDLTVNIDGTDDTTYALAFNATTGALSTVDGVAPAVQNISYAPGGGAAEMVFEVNVNALAESVWPGDTTEDALTGAFGNAAIPNHTAAFDNTNLLDGDHAIGDVVSVSTTYDSDTGTDVEADYNFTKTGANTWRLDVVLENGEAATTTTPYNLVFDQTTGALTSINGGAVAVQNIAAYAPQSGGQTLNFAIDVTAMLQVAPDTDDTDLATNATFANTQPVYSFDLNGSLDANDVLGSPTYSPATFNLTDSEGNAHTATVTYTHNTTANEWNMNVSISGGAAAYSQDYTLAFDADGVLSTVDGAAPGPITLPIFNPQVANAAEMQITFDPSVTPLTALTDGANGNAVIASANVDGSAQSVFDATNTNTYNSSTSLTIFDSLGTSHLATTYYRKTPVPNEWETYTFVDGTQVDGPSTMAFSALGAIITPAPPSEITVAAFAPGGGAANLTLTLDYSDATQYGSNFSINALDQNGYTTGRLSGIDIADTGVITSRFTNGQSRTIAQVALANFANSQGLRQLGSTAWAESFESGAALVSAPGSGNLGTIQSGALEGSNVDLTEQLVQMITTQRNFQANAQVITTADTITQTIINI